MLHQRRRKSSRHAANGELEAHYYGAEFAANAEVTSHFLEAPDEDCESLEDGEESFQAAEHNNNERKSFECKNKKTMNDVLKILTSKMKGSSLKTLDQPLEMTDLEIKRFVLKLVLKILRFCKKTKELN